MNHSDVWGQLLRDCLADCAEALQQSFQRAVKLLEELVNGLVNNPPDDVARALDSIAAEVQNQGWAIEQASLPILEAAIHQAIGQSAGGPADVTPSLQRRTVESYDDDGAFVATVVPDVGEPPGDASTTPAEVPAQSGKGSEPSENAFAQRSVGLIYFSIDELTKRGVTDHSISEWQRLGYHFGTYDFTALLGLTEDQFSAEPTWYRNTEDKGISGVTIRNDVTGETWYGLPETVRTWKGGFYPGQKGAGPYWRSWVETPQPTGTLDAGMTYYNLEPLGRRSDEGC